MESHGKPVVEGQIVRHAHVFFKLLLLQDSPGVQELFVLTYDAV